ncbi:MAG TPA: MFS transporter [Polyangiales bacterium]
MKKLAALLVLYFAQGLPFGFQATALPLMLRERGVSLQAIGFSGLLAAPWLGKAIWAPLVDRYHSARFGRRKSWIVPMQFALALCALIAAHTDAPVALAACVFAMNFFAATQDIAVDALAVQWLEPQELGVGNAIQVVGYKLGMLTGGGLLVWASGFIGFHGLFQAMAALLFAVFFMSLGLNERGRDVPSQLATAIDFSEIARRLRTAFRKPSTRSLLAIVLTYKMGETLAEAMWKPMLVDRGFSAPQIGLWAGTYGMLFSLFGSAAAGLMLRRLPLTAALLFSAAFRASGVAAEWWISASGQVSAFAIIAATCLEHLAAGALTTVLFALMMRHTDREIGGSHYTLLSSLEVWGKMPFGLLSGVIAASCGYPGLFSIATGLCVAFSVLAFALRDRLDLPDAPRGRDQPLPLTAAMNASTASSVVSNEVTSRRTAGPRSGQS